MRARHRRNQIVKEAARLGVLVPGVPGYVPMRDRQMTWARADGSEDPDWWEVEGKTRLPEEAQEAEVEPVRNVSHLPDDEELVSSHRFHVRLKLKEK